MASLFPNSPPPFFFCRYTNQKDGCLWVFYLSIWRWWKWADDRIGPCLFCFFPPLALFPWYLVAVGRRWWFIRRKSPRPTHIYVWITFLLFAVPFIVWFRFGSGVYSFYSQFRLGKYRDFVFFFPFLFTFPNTPYCLLPPLHIWVYPLLRCWFFFLRLFSPIGSFELTIPYFIS